MSCCGRCHDALSRHVGDHHPIPSGKFFGGLPLDYQESTPSLSSQSAKYPPYLMQLPVPISVFNE
eukprot:765992-Hanusia_phi.AAC.4